MKKTLLLIGLTGLIFPASGCSERPGAPLGESDNGSPRLSELLGADDESGYARVLEPRSFSFPEDHGPHPQYRNEWWYVTGNLDAAGGERFGFELTIFRFALAPADRSESAETQSAWTSNEVYIGHFAVTDATAGEFHVAERHARAALGLAGAEARPLRVWVEDWWLGATAKGASAYASGPLRLHAAHRGVELSLSLQALKPPVLNGIAGLSQKSAEPGNASYYYSISRLQAEGGLSIAGERYAVSGLAWLDREWGSSALSTEQDGWDWFALQLSDGSELMFYRLRRAGGTDDPHSAGTWIPKQGPSEHLSQNDVRIEVRDYWDSPKGGRYPNAWTIGVPRLDLRLDIDPVLDAQELETTVRYWEGAVDATGSRSGNAVEGRGYVELTGYARD
jgi:predicted secreted hydrolase